MAKFRHLTTPFSLKGLSLKNRVVMPPMCQYQATDGLPNSWHFVHYVSRAVGGVGLVIVEMTNVAPNGRISPNCSGCGTMSSAMRLSASLMKCTLRVER